ncbi:tRNA threonylcarbamoyladenosine dehydratase [Treponema brennaborense]|uniref:UBA/THIF-type NAD/FAD binding protein n=1 Tax=Treponema brennaborense (strain DSM 12168 / CIP 105900 / DD5/3) TaxID=906968 RepID=F4LNW9_TREBD|nr:tRNA threonylcarbamoyladenosine dehydratase [Treponema brennaborense]AEE17946.1 UBA/THIF-type NAD/FAD binding protein [Treponema brennaborense DSM 12168]
MTELREPIFDGRHSRTERLIGAEALERIKSAKVAVVGLGGVGSFAAESLARAGIERFVLLDSDCVTESNINRQNIALYSTVGKLKTDVLRRRILDINPGADITVYPIFYGKDTARDVDFSGCSYIADAIDNVTGKLLLVETAARLDIPLISAMGAGNKLDPSRFEIADIYDTSVCPLARVMRRELKKRGVPALTVVYSKEPPYAATFDTATAAAQTAASADTAASGESPDIRVLREITGNPPISRTPQKNTGNPPPRLASSPGSYRKPVPASISFVPAAAGLLMASRIITDIASL